LKEFLTDADPILEKFRSQLTICRQELPEQTLLDDLFRHLHSLKSGAAFFQLNDVENHIHSMESLFDEMKKSGDEARFFRKASELSDEIPRLEELLRQSSDEDARYFVDQSDDPIEISLSGRSGGEDHIELSPFQKQLLWEAERREDQLFCLTVQMDPDERLPYVRAFLILNNLEIRSNVIYTHPVPDSEDQDYSTLTFILTSDTGDSPVFEAVNVDGILQTSLVQMDYSHFSSSGKKGNSHSDIMVQETLAPVMSKVELETDTVSRLKESLIEMKEIVLPLPPGLHQKEPLLGLIREMEQDLSEVSLIPLSSLFSNLKRFVKDSGERMDKKISCDFRGGQFGLSIRSLELVSRVLIQLIRNAVSHGIESPSQRLEAGKNPVGMISLIARQEGASIKLLFQDDGKGVDLDGVNRKLSQNGETLDNREKLLGILTRPGFSTNENPDRMSGRGIGLDLVAHDVENALGGSLELETDPGKGTRFILTLPGERDMIPMMVFQMENRLLALPKRNVAGIFPMDRKSVEQKEHNLLYYRIGEGSFPLFNLRGMISRKNLNFVTPYILVIQHLGRKAVMSVDDLVLERDIPRDHFILGDQKEPFIYDVSISGETADFMYLSPALIG
jgi:two-component system chemotaxis sensor kinase CheA